jgi:cyanate lyase
MGVKLKKEIMEDQFDGLMAVMDVMIKLDEIDDGEKYKETFKNKFAYEHR